MELEFPARINKKCMELIELVTIQHSNHTTRITVRFCPRSL